MPWSWSLRSRALAVVLAAALGAPLWGSGSAAAIPIPGDPLPPAGPAFVGSPAEPRPVRAPRPPQHPYLARDPGNNIHNDAYMTDAYPGPGPLGRRPQVRSTLQVAECASLTFDRRGRLVTVCVGVTTVTLKLLHPRTLEELASYALPGRRLGLDVFSDFSGGGYFYLDHRDRAVVPTGTNHLLVVGHDRAGTDFVLRRDFDVSGLLSRDDKIISVLPAWSGEYVFVTERGVVGAVDRRSGRVRLLRLGETVTNSFAVDETGGIYVVSARAMYRLDLDRRGRPRVSWRERYRNTGETKPGQVSPGSGTTPTLMGRKWVAITDNADPMRIVVYRRGRDVRGRRQVCAQPVFRKGASATDNTLIAAGRSLIVTNNHGYLGPVRTLAGQGTAPGVERVDLDADGRGCRVVWRNRTVRSPSAVPKLSLATGLVYVVGHERQRQVDEWFLTAISFRTGRVVFQQRYGTGLGHNPNYAPVTLARDGTAYVGVLGGLVRIADRRQ